MTSAEFTMECGTVADVVDAWSERGYVADFRASPEGLRASGCGAVHQPEEFQVDGVSRFEGISNPDDEAIVFALTCPVHGTRGTFVVAYGPKMPAVDADIAERLHLDPERVAALGG